MTLFWGGMGSPASGATGGWLAVGLPPGLAAGADAGGAEAAGADAGGADAGGAEPAAAVTMTWPVICVGWTWQK